MKTITTEYWEPILKEIQLDLMLGGHDHQWKLLPNKLVAVLPGR